MDVVVERTSSLSLILFQPDHAKAASRHPEEPPTPGGSSNAIGSAWRTKHLSFVKNQNKKHIHSGPESGSILALRLMFWDLFSWWHFYVTHHFSPQFERIFLEFSRSIICKSKLFKKKALDISHPKVWCFKLKEPLCLVTFCLVNPWVKSVDVFLDPENPGPPWSPRQTFRKHQLLGFRVFFGDILLFFTEP